MKTYLFVGPSITPKAAQECAKWATVLPPVQAGDLLRLNLRPGDQVGIIDGYFKQCPAVRHKEILALLADGIEVHGAASLGALRAAELSEYGMIGHGRIFTDYSTGFIDADDEVALLHGTVNEAFEIFTIALVNLRYALMDAVTENIISEIDAETVLQKVARLSFTERTREQILAVMTSTLPPSAQVLMITRVENMRDVKRDDAHALIDVLRKKSERSLVSPERTWKLHRTVQLAKWQREAVGQSLLASAGDERTFRYARLFASDYARLLETVGARAIADGCLNRDNKTLGRVQYECHPLTSHEYTRLVEELRCYGILGETELCNTGLEQWCSAEERAYLTPEILTAKAASRSLHSEGRLAFYNPLQLVLDRHPGSLRVQKGAQAAVRFNISLAAQGYEYRHLRVREASIASVFANIWKVGDVSDELLKRGYSSIGQFAHDARPYYYYAKTHPDSSFSILD